MKEGRKERRSEGRRWRNVEHNDKDITDEEEGCQIYNEKEKY